MSDFLAAYHVLPIGEAMSYLVFVQMELNRPRVRLQNALDVARGLSAVLSQEDLSRAWADAQALDISEVSAIEGRTTWARAEARDRAGKRRGWMGA